MNEETLKSKPEPWGLATQIELHCCNPGTIRNADMIKQFVIDLCDLIDMKRFGECHVVHFGEEERVAGFSMFQLIETSCISGHFANATNAVYLDIFSCKWYDIDKTIKFCTEFFQAKGEITSFYRERY